MEWVDGMEAASHVGDTATRQAYAGKLYDFLVSEVEQRRAAPRDDLLSALRVGDGDSLLVTGTGAVGLSAIMAARTAGAATIIAVDPVKRRRALALDLGATHALDPADVAGGAPAPLTGPPGFPLETLRPPEGIRPPP